MTTTASALERWKRYYRPVKFETALERESTLFAVRAFAAAKLYHYLPRSNRITDGDVLPLLGFTLIDDDEVGDTVALRAAVQWQQARLTRQLTRHPCTDVANLYRLCNLLHFSQVEYAAAYLALMLSQSSAFSELLGLLGRHPSPRACFALFARPLGIDPHDLRVAIAPTSRLARAGLVEQRDVDDEPTPSMPDNIRRALELDGFDASTFLRRLVRPAPAPRLTLTDFAYLQQLGVLKDYLARAQAQSLKGVNILLYGPPGTGKTELARALVADIGTKLFEVPNEDDDGEAIGGQRRFGAYALCQQILAAQPDATLLFDEAEDVFWRPDPWMMFRSDTTSTRGKSWTNELLETNAAPTLWTCNEIGAFDPAYLRRFDMVIEMRTPPRSVRRRIVNRYFGQGTITTPCADRLAAVEGLPPAIIERTAHVVGTVASGNVRARDATAVQLVEATLRAMGVRATLPAAALPEHYDPAFVNADRDLDALITGLRKHPHARLCLYGPPGSGKTAFAHYLGRVMDAPVLVRRGSDLISKWVGETEQNIAAAFQAARDDKAILVIDEADGILRERSSANMSWEVTQVNELLTQMEAFEGIFIASTNQTESLDAAALRRFDFKSHFGYLKPAQRRGLLAAVCGIDPAALDEAVVPALERMGLLTPGDFTNVLRQLVITDAPATPGALIRLLAAEIDLKPDARHRPIGFGV